MTPLSEKIIVCLTFSVWCGKYSYAIQSIASASTIILITKKKKLYIFFFQLSSPPNPPFNNSLSLSAKIINCRLQRNYCIHPPSRIYLNPRTSTAAPLASSVALFLFSNLLLLHRYDPAFLSVFFPRKCLEVVLHDINLQFYISHCSLYTARPCFVVFIFIFIFRGRKNRVRFFKYVNYWLILILFICDHGVEVISYELFMCLFWILLFVRRKKRKFMISTR